MSLLATSGIPVLNYLPNFLTLAPLLSNAAFALGGSQITLYMGPC